MNYDMNYDCIQMRIELRTHCPKCGVLWMSTSELLLPIPGSALNYMARMRKELESFPKKCCTEKQLPIPSAQWESVWELPHSRPKV